MIVNVCPGFHKLISFFSSIWHFFIWHSSQLLVLTMNHFQKSTFKYAYDHLKKLKYLILIALTVMPPKYKLFCKHRGYLMMNRKDSNKTYQATTFFRSFFIFPFWSYFKVFSDNSLMKSARYSVNYWAQEDKIRHHPYLCVIHGLKGERDVQFHSYLE